MNDKLVLLKRITIEDLKCGGRPCIRNLRLRVADVPKLLSAGATHEEILEDFPSLVRQDWMGGRVERVEFAWERGKVRLPKWIS